MTRWLGIGSTAAVVAGVVLIVAELAVIPGVVVLLLGFTLGAILGGISMLRRTMSAVRDWQSLLSDGGPSAINVVGVEPPQGIVFNRDTTVTLEITGKDGQTRQVQKGLRVPIPQAIMWRLAGRVPGPLGTLIAAPNVDVPLYRKRSA